MPKTAVFWIRDGVLIDRMPVNAVAFAVASLSHADEEAAAKTSFTALVNFAFETSGVSCGDKIRKFNHEKLPLVEDVSAAVTYYNRIAGMAAASCDYFAGAPDLVARMNSLGLMNFITSAVEQSVLDEWVESAQAKTLVPHLTEILGEREGGFSKGWDHFAYARERYGVERVLYIADAVAEISTGAQLAGEFNIVPIGFAHVITAGDIRHACQLVPSCARLDEEQLVLPDESTLVQSLKDAGAASVVSGDAGQIIGDLEICLKANLSMSL